MSLDYHIFLGATVADAAARPLHWVYDPKKLNSILRIKKTLLFSRKIDVHFITSKLVMFRATTMWVK